MHKDRLLKSLGCSSDDYMALAILPSLPTGTATSYDFDPGIQGIKGHESSCDMMFCQVR